MSHYPVASVLQQEVFALKHERDMLRTRIASALAYAKDRLDGDRPQIDTPLSIIIGLLEGDPNVTRVHGGKP